MAFYGDPDELERIAKEIETKAEKVRSDATAMAKQAARAHWHSIAADRCRELINDDMRRLHTCADNLDDAAAKLRKHAQKVREMIAEIKRIAEAVTHWFTSAVDTFNRAVETFKNAAQDFVDGVGDALGFGSDDPPKPPQPPWHGWPWQPHNLPPEGDKAWLDVGDFMAKQGVAA